MGKRQPRYNDPCVPFLMKLDKSTLVDCIVDLLRPLDADSADMPVTKEFALDRLLPILHEIGKVQP